MIPDEGADGLTYSLMSPGVRTPRPPEGITTFGIYAALAIVLSGTSVYEDCAGIPEGEAVAGLTTNVEPAAAFCEVVSPGGLADVEIVEFPMVPTVSVLL